jgi:hypothetical protein
MGKLAVLLQWAVSVVEVMLAKLSLVLLLQSVDLSLVSIEIVIVGLLSQLSNDLSWWIVEVPWSSISINALSLIPRFLLSR